MDGSKKCVTFDGGEDENDETIPPIESEENGDDSTPIDDEDEEETVSFVNSKTKISSSILDKR
jgi:hypothetical protein